MTPMQRAGYLAHARTAAYRRRVDEASGALREGARVGKLVVMSSWGKDSVVLADLAIKEFGAVDVMHIASSYRIPGWEQVQAHFAARARVHVIEPRRSLEETIKWLHEVGLPHERDQTQQDAIVKAIKKDVGTDWCKARGFAVQALGIRAEESARRRRFLRSVGMSYAARGLRIVAPLAWWSAKDVWARIVERDLPYHPMYDCESHGFTRETIRNAGWLSTDAAHKGRIVWLREHYPALYRALAAEFPDVRAFA